MEIYDDFQHYKNIIIMVNHGTEFRDKKKCSLPADIVTWKGVDKEIFRYLPKVMNILRIITHEIRQCTTDTLIIDFHNHI
jgi:hypothetical protein